MKFVWFCAAGYPFFIGAAILTFAMFLSTFHRKLWSKPIVYALTIIGALLIFLSATPFPFWFYITWAIAIIAWLLITTLRLHQNSKARTISSIIAMCLSIIALLVELPFHLNPSVPAEKHEKLYIIGDSVSAGIGGEREKTWPRILRENYGINVIDLSQSAATVASAMVQAVQVDSENAIVLLEIGGNDLFAPTPPSLFEKHMEQLLKTVSNSKRTVVMLELPLQPSHISYGRIQRRIAKQFNVILIPKRLFVSVLSGKGASIDLAHLSPAGHELMAKKIWSLVGNSMLQTLGPVENQSQ